MLEERLGPKCSGISSIAWIDACRGVMLSRPYVSGLAIPTSMWCPSTRLCWKLSTSKTVTHDKSVVLHSSEPDLAIMFLQLWSLVVQANGSAAHCKLARDTVCSLLQTVNQTNLTQRSAQDLSLLKTCPSAMIATLSFLSCVPCALKFQPQPRQRCLNR